MKNHYSLKYLALLLLMLTTSGINSAYAAEHCNDSYYIDQTFANGARWDMCWTHDDNHGIRYHHIYYTPKNGTRRMVLVDAAVSQIHVPYDDNGARYHDVSDYGLGSGYLRNMSNAECPGGKLHSYGTKKAICSQVKKKYNAYRFGSTAASQDTLKIFSISKVGKYVYIPQWLFYDDGKIEPSLIATGSLQRFTTKAQHGWLMDEGKIGVSHIHNYFWRLDFDLGGTAKDDLVQEVNYNVSSGKRLRTLTPFTSEAARSVSPTQQRSWMISDKTLKNSKNHSIGYELNLGKTGHREIGPSYEPFTGNDFYVTKAKSCEQIASHNKRINSCTADSLDQFVNGESISNEDLIVWVGLSFYHMPRAEDFPRMDAHSNTFKIIPRDWHANNPLNTLVVSGRSDTASTASGTMVTIDALANDSGEGISLYTVSNPANGTAVIRNGKIDYTPNAGFVGTESFSYNIISPTGNVYPVQIAVTVSAPVVVIPLPVARPDVLTVQKNTTTMIDVLGNDTGSVLVLQQLTSQSDNGGAVSLRNNQIQYTPRRDFIGVDTFSYTFKDSLGRNSGARVTITVEGEAEPVNAQPVANSQSISLTTNLRANVQLTASDADGGALTYQVIRSPQHGRLTGTAPNFVYIPTADYVGADSFTFIASDGRADSNVATVSIAVNAELSDATSNLLTSPLALDGSAADWATVNRFPADPNDISQGQINWRGLAMAHDASKVHLLYENHGNIRADSTSGSYIPWGWQVYMDTDKNSQTGFKVGGIGADFILEGPALHRYTGIGTNWNWETVDVASSQYNGSVAELNFPRSKIGNPNEIYLLIQGNNAAVGGTEVDYYPDAQSDASSPDGYFHYRFASGGVDPVPPTTVPTGVLLASNAAPEGSIQLNGDDSEWGNLQAFSADPNDMARPTDTIDWEDVTMAHSDTKLYVMYRNHSAINANSLTNDYIPWGWQTYIDTDGDASTGFKVGDIGADYIIEATLVSQYTGDGSSWSWEVKEPIDLFYQNELAEFSFSLAAIGNPNSIRVVFKGNNLSVGGSDVDLYPDNADTAGAQNNYFTYSLDNSLQTASQRPSVTNQDVDVSAAQTNQVTLNATAARGESLSYQLITPPANGVLGELGTVVDYTPNDGFVGTDSFEYVLNNGIYDSSVAKVNLLVAARSATDGSNGSDGGSGSGDGDDSGGGSLSITLQGLVFLLLLMGQLRARRFVLRGRS